MHIHHAGNYIHQGENGKEKWYWPGDFFSFCWQTALETGGSLASCKMGCDDPGWRIFPQPCWKREWGGLGNKPEPAIFLVFLTASRYAKFLIKNGRVFNSSEVKITLALSISLSWIWIWIRRVRFYVCTLAKIPREHVPKSHVTTCDFAICGIFVTVSCNWY